MSQGRLKKDNEMMKGKANKDRYNSLVKEAKNSAECKDLIADDFSYSCVTYQISPSCFREHLGNRGLEFGQEN